MPITLNPPHEHPTYPGLMMDRLAVESVTIRYASGFDRPGQIEVSLRPYAVVTSGQKEIDLPAANYGTIDLVIPNIADYVKTQAEAGDADPYQLMQLLVKVVGAEYARQHAGG